jgi:hypothetical protein
MTLTLQGVVAPEGRCGRARTLITKVWDDYTSCRWKVLLSLVHRSRQFPAYSL